MRKKYLSALLFGALLVTSAGTFTSCKDYDDDINNLQEQITANADAIKKLQEMIGDGKFVTNITSENNGLKITWNDGNSTVIENVINGEAQQGDVVSIDPETGEIKINNEGTGFFASKGEDEEEVKLPYVNDEGVLVLIDAEGKEVVTGIRVAPVTAVVNEDGSAVLTIIAADGTKQTVNIPSAASSISEIELLDDDFAAVTTNKVITLLYWNATKTTKWEGPKGNIPENAKTYSTDAQTINTKITPSTVNAEELDWTLVNSKGQVSFLKLSAKNYDELLTRAATNGLYTVTVNADTYVGNEDSFKKTFDKDGNLSSTTSDNIRFALSPANNTLKSLYNITVAPSNQTTADLGNIKLGDNEITAVGTDYTTKPGTWRQFKVGQEVNVSVKNEHNLYDMYITVSPEDAELFGIEISEDKRSFKATKSPDNVTDATIDLYVHTLSNLGGDTNIKTTTITVEINRTLGEATYDKQTYMPTKVNDAFLVSADKLKESLGDNLNAWYASVNKTITLTGIYDDEACKTASDLESGQLTVTMNKDKDNLTANIATELNYLKFQLTINKNTKPLKIGKTYYAKLSFVDKTSNVELNNVVVPFELTKPELSSILVKESGVFRDGNDLAYAYLYAGDAVYPASGDYAYSAYQLKRAFTDMSTKLSNAQMTTYTFTADNTNKVKDTDVYTKDLAEVTNTYVSLFDVDGNNDGLKDGYKKDLNIKFEGHYLDVEDDSYKYTQTYQFRVMSPILEGEAIAANNLVEVSATGTTKLYKEDIWAKTYNNDVKYDIFAKGGTDDKPVWYRDDIKNVVFTSGNNNVFEVSVGTPKAPTGSVADGDFVDSYIEVKGITENTAKLKVAITDIWGYTLKDEVDIKTTLNLGE